MASWATRCCWCRRAAWAWFINRDPTWLADANINFLGDRNLLGYGRRHHFRGAIWDFVRHGVRNHLGHAYRNGLANHFGLHRADGGRHLLDAFFLDQAASRHGNELFDRGRHHAGHRVGNLLGVGFRNRPADGVWNLTNMGFWHHLGRRVVRHAGANSTFNEHLTSTILVTTTLDARCIRAATNNPVRARSFAAACLIHVATTYSPHHGVGNLFLDHFAHVTGDRDGNLLGVGFFHHAGNGRWDLLGHRVRDFLANRHRYLFANRLADINRARNLLAHRAVRADLAGAGFARATLQAQFGAALFLVRLAGARIECTGVLGHADQLQLTWHRVRLTTIFWDRPADGLHDRLWFAIAPGTVLDHRFGAILVGRLTHGSHHGFANRAAGGVANGLVVRFADRFAQRLAAFAVVRFADGFAHLVSVRLLVRFADRFAGRVGAFLIVRFLHLLVDGVAAVLVVCFRDRMAHCFNDLFHRRFLNRAEVRVRHVLHDRFVGWPGDRFLHLLILRFLNGFIASLDFIPISGLGDRLHHCFAHRLVTNVEAFFQHGVIHQLARRADVVIASRKADLSVPTCRRTAPGAS